MSDNKNSSNDKSSRNIIFLPLCIAIGIVLGTAMGAAFQNIPIGICIGMGAGALLGGLVTAVAYSKNKGNK